MARRKKSTFKKSLLLFCVLLLIGGIFVLRYVYNSLIEYDLGDIDIYMTHLLEDMKTSMKKGNVEKYFALSNVTSDLEKSSSLIEGYKELSSSNFTYKKKENLVYDVYADDDKIATVKINDSKKETRLLILTFNKYEIDSVESYNNEGIFKRTIKVPNNYKVIINDNTLDKTYIKKEEKITPLEEAYSSVALPTLTTYEVKNLTRKPKLVIQDEQGKNITPEYKDGVYIVNPYNVTNDEQIIKNNIKDNFDPLSYAKTYSLFMTKDLQGSWYGLDTISKMILANTTLSKRVYSWAHGVDITFTSVHTLDKETFTDVEAKNYTFYGDNAFSVEMSFCKHMTLNRTNDNKRSDTYDEIVYFVYTKDGYKAVSTTSSSNTGMKKKICDAYVK